MTLTLSDDASAAELIALDYDPAGLVQGLDAAQDPLLGAAALRAGLDDTAVSLPVGRSLYGYWANGAMLDALLGVGGTTALQNATWAEWSDFVETLQAWAGGARPRHRDAGRQRLRPARGQTRYADRHRRLCAADGPRRRLPPRRCWPPGPSKPLIR